MKKFCMMLCLVLGIVGATASASVLAHVQNEKNLYSDIEYSEATEEIVLLHGIRVISMEGGANLYKPFELLTKSDLAYWAGTFHGLGGEGATADRIREAALNEGLVDSLEGHATYADVNQAYFAGKAETLQPDETLTREQFALYMSTYFTAEVDGKTLFDMAEYVEGPTGIVADVEKSEVTEGGNTYDVFRINIDGEWVQVSNHPKILNGPVDLTLWKDKAVVASWYGKAEPGSEPQLEIIRVAEAEFTPEEIAAEAGAALDHTDHTDAHDAASHDSQEADRDEESSQANSGGDRAAGNAADVTHTESASSEENKAAIMPFPVILIVGIALLIVIIIWLFVRRK